jgi:hypothetical protein
METFSISCVSNDIEKWASHHKLDLTSAKASENVGSGLEYQAAPVTGMGG